MTKMSQTSRGWLGVVLIVVTSGWASTALCEDDPYLDPRMRQWSELARAGRHRVVIRQVERDLASKRPHPYARSVWYDVHVKLRDLDRAVARAPRAVREAFGPWLGIVRDLAADRDLQAVEAWRRLPEAERFVEDPYLLMSMHVALRNVGAGEEVIETAVRANLGYLSVWFVDEDASDMRRNGALREAMRSGPWSNSTPEGRYLAALVPYPVKELDRLRASAVYLEARPRDPHAHRKMGVALSTFEAEAEAVQHLREALELMPFWWGSTSSARLIEATLWTEGDEGAARAAKALARLVAPRSAGAASQRLLAHAYRLDENWGAARRVLDAARVRWPRDVSLAREMVRVLRHEKRSGDAVALLEPFVAAHPDDTALLKQYLDAINDSGKPKRAIEAWERYGAPAHLVPGVAKSLSRAFANAGRRDDAIAILEQALERYPDTDLARWLAEQLNARGQGEAALARLRPWLERKPGDNVAIYYLATWTKALDAEDAAEAALRAQLERRPWIYNTRTILADYVDDQEKLYEEIAEKVPALAFPVEHLVQRKLRAQRFEEAHQVLDRLGPRVEDGGRAAEQLEIARLRWSIYYEQSKRGALDVETMEKKWRDAHAEMVRRGRKPSTAKFELARMENALGNPEAAAAAFLESSVRQPNNYWTAFQESIGAKIEDAQKFEIVYRAWRRDSYNATRLGHFYKLHTLWGGSDAATLKMLDWARKNAPHGYSSHWEVKARDSYGEARPHYRREYSSARGIAASLRYFQWHEASKRKARGPQSQVELLESNPDIAKVRIVQPDGTVEIREDSLVTGRPLYRERNRAWVRFGYNDKGKLRKGRTSNGRSISLDYDDEGQIVRFVDGGEQKRDLRFEYSPRGKPTLIELVGVGTLRVTYGPEGEIVDTQADGGPRVALEVTSAFQSLLSIVQVVQTPTGIERFAAEIEPDPRLRHLTQGWQESSGDEEWAAGVALGRYLLDTLEQDPNRGRMVGKLVKALHNRARTTVRAAQLTPLLVDFHTNVRPAGATEEELVRWHDLRRRLELDGRPQAQRAAHQLTRRAPGLLPEARWLPASYLDVEGYYRPFGWQESQPGYMSSPPSAVLVRANGDVLMGHDHGFELFSGGYWRHWGFDGKRDRFVRADGSQDPEDRVLGFAEDASGNLYVATGGGLLVLPTGHAYDGELRTYRSKADGLPEGARGIKAVVAVEAGALLATERGVLALVDGTLRQLSPQLAAPVLGLSAHGPHLLVRTKRALYGVNLADLSVGRLAGAVEHALATPMGAFWVRRDRVLGRAWRESRARPLLGQEDILRSEKIRGLSMLPLDDGRPHLAVLTDRGFSVFAKHHFEHVKVRSFDQEVGVTHLHWRGSRTAIVTTSGPVLLEQFRAKTHTKVGQVHDLLELPERDLVLVAADRGLFAIFTDRADEGPVQVASTTVRHLARDPDGGVVAHDGSEVLRYDLLDGLEGLERPRTLFTANASWPGRKDGAGPIQSLIVAKDRSVWVATKTTLFRWKAGKVDKYSYFADPEIFPSRTHWLSEVIETVDGRIWVVGSSETHIQHRGVRMDGGLLELRGDRFVRSRLHEQSAYWFMTGYTPISDTEAIVGSGQGFARHTRGRLAGFQSDLADRSYQALYATDRKLWLGTRGTRIGEDLWLFGTGGGLVLRAKGEWIRPERINWMLPHPELAKLGGRHVRAVATDGNGRIYAGTDFGLFEYDSGGGDPLGFLLSHAQRSARPDLLVSEARRRWSDNVQTLLSSIPADSPAGQSLRAYLDAKGELEQFGPKAMIDAPRDDEAEATSTGEAAERKRRDDLLKGRLREREGRLNTLLLRIKRQHPYLHSLLTVQPEDLKSLRERLDPGQVVLQFIPLRNELKIHIVRRNGTSIVNVKTPQKDLFTRAARAATLLDRLAATRNVASAAVAPPKSLLDKDQVLFEDLHWLYLQLLDPVVDALEGSSTVLVSAGGPLAYVPFSALIETPGLRPKYAVERFGFATLPDLFTLQEAFGRPEASGDLSHSLVVGDPDETLPGAREEAQQVAKLLDNEEPWIGSVATLDRIRASSPQSRVVHLATHGILDALEPERSHLVLANGERLSIGQAMELELDQASIVTLSACETARGGGSGLEYSTLATAFSKAGAPAIVATLWNVPDTPSKELMVRFYRELLKSQGRDRLGALTRAQRRMLQSEHHAHPSDWAGYVLFGRP